MINKIYCIILCFFCAVRCCVFVKKAENSLYQITAPLRRFFEQRAFRRFSPFSPAMVLLTA
ncbi:hypothetical protein OFN17_23285, partial [Escherichia coli]|nr:hypothetical protein [Escherichia coli]